MVNCDIIIPTYNRPAYLHRILDYYDSFGEALSIIVADSSSDENKKLNRDIIASVSNLNIRYLDHYSTEINPHHKFSDVVNYAKQKYCVLCADDDFVTLNGIKQSVDFLEKNPDFAVAHGQYIGFHLEEDKKGERQFVWKLTDSHESIAFSGPAMRLSHHLSCYSQSTIYGVHRTGLLQMVYQEVLKSEVDPMLFGEFLPSMLTLIYGKMKCLDVLYAARDAYSTGSWPTLKDAIRAGVYDREYPKFRNCLATHLSRQSRLDIEKSGKLVDDAMSAYLKKYFYPSKNKMSMGYITTRIGQTLDNLHLPGWLNRGIRKPYKEFVEPRYVKKYSKDMSPFSKDYENLNRVRRHVLSCSK